jgi:hypothetical protein
MQIDGTTIRSIGNRTKTWLFNSGLNFLYFENLLFKIEMKVLNSEPEVGPVESIIL